MVFDKEIEDFIFLEALKNAYNFKGKANPKALIGKVIGKFPKVKEDMKGLNILINDIVNKVNEYGLEKQKEEILEKDPSFFNKEQKNKKKSKEDLFKLPDLENLNGEKLRVRTEPAPSGYLHIGHAYNIVYNYEYKKKYNGDFILRFGDTNPDNVEKENYDKILEDVKWLTDNGIDEIYYQSERLKIYYKYLRELISIGKAYVCECEPEIFKSFNDSSTSCPHREIDIEKQLEKYENMLAGKYRPGEVVVRFKADLKNKNPALRDFPIARLNYNKHPLVGDKYKVWPMMNLTVAIDDSLMNINYVIRGKDHEINMVRQNMIQKSLNLKIPNYFHIGRVKFENVELSKTKLSALIKEGVYEGWDDPRVPSLLSFRKRGYEAKAFRDMILAQGISKRDSKITIEEFYKNLNYYNKQILEKKAERYFAVFDPIEIEIENISEIDFKKIILPKHPEIKSMGQREMNVEKNYFIDKDDAQVLNQGDRIRLMHFANFEILRKENDKIYLKYISKEYDKSLKLKRNIHFVPINNNENIKIIMPDNNKIDAICERLPNLKEDSKIQFERKGFVKFDSFDKDKKRIFYFIHK